MSARLKVSRAGIDLLKAFEGFRRRAARLPDGRWTVGYGHTLSAREGAEVSEADAEALLIFDLLPIADAVEAAVNTPLTQNQFDALVAFAFNVGLDAFRSSKVLERVQAGRLTEAAMALDAWRNAELDGRSVPLDPLVRRRSAEKALFLTPPGGAFAVPTALLRPSRDAAVEAIAPARGLADVEIPFDGPVAGVRVISMPEPEPEAAPEVEESVEASEAVEPRPAASAAVAAPETAASPPPKPASGPAPVPGWRPNGLPAVRVGGFEPAASAPAPAPRPAPPPRPTAATLQLYAPYASVMHGPLPLGRPAARETRSAPSASAAGRETLDAEPAPGAARPPSAEEATVPVVAAPLQLPPRPAEPTTFQPSPQPEPAAWAGPVAGATTAEPLILTPPPDPSPTAVFASPQEQDAPPPEGEEPALFDDQSPRIVRHEVVMDGARPDADESESGVGRTWWMIAALGVVFSSGALAAFFRRDDYYGSNALLGDPTTLAWILAAIGAVCLTTSAYFLLKRVGGVKD